LTDQDNCMELFVLISKHRMINHYLPKLITCLENITDEQIWSKETVGSNSIGGIVLHVLEHIKRNTQRLKNPGSIFDKGIEDYFPQATLNKNDLLNEIAISFKELGEAFNNTHIIDMHSIYHLIEHTGYHLGQLVQSSQKFSGIKYHFVQNGIDERALRRRIEEELGL
jgi:hypothetical protein